MGITSLSSWGKMQSDFSSVPGRSHTVNKSQFLPLFFLIKHSSPFCFAFFPLQDHNSDFIPDTKAGIHVTDIQLAVNLAGMQKHLFIPQGWTCNSRLLGEHQVQIPVLQEEAAPENRCGQGHRAHVGWWHDGPSPQLLKLMSLLG